MSGALVNLVARGTQDAFILSDQLENSLFRMRFNRHTNFSQAPKYIDTIQGGVGQVVVVEIPSLGDLLTTLWFEGNDISEQFRGARFDLIIGGQIVDSQDATFISDIWPIYMADSYTKAQNINNRVSGANKRFYPLHFFFCDNWQNIPLLALQYHKVEIKITLGGSTDCKMYGNFVYLDTKERQEFVSSKKSFVITQVQHLTAPVESNGDAVLDLSSLNHPVRSLFWGYRADDEDPAVDKFLFNSCDIYVNGTTLLEKMSPTYFHSVQGYYNTPTGMINMDQIEGCPFYTRFYSFNFCINSSSYKPTGTLNFSRVDNAKISLKGVVQGSLHTGQDIDVYAVNYNILNIESGMCGVLFSN